MSDPPAKKAKPDPYAKWQSARDEKTGAVYYYHTDTKATSWTWPPPLDDGDKADTPSDDVPDFEASATYQGRRPGRVFKRGDRGQGYYRDNPFGGVPVGQKCERYNPHA